MRREERLRLIQTTCLLNNLFLKFALAISNIWYLRSPANLSDRLKCTLINDSEFDIQEYILYPSIKLIIVLCNEIEFI